MDNMPSLPSAVAAMALASCLLTGSAAAQTAAAPEPRRMGYVAGGMLLTEQAGPSGEAPRTYIEAPGGSTVGWLGGAGLFLTSGLSLGVEASTTGLMRARQPSRHGYTYNEERRDQFFSFVLRGHIPITNMSLEPLAGVALVRRDAWRQTEYRPIGFPGAPAQIGSRHAIDLSGSTGLATGLDVQIGGPRVAVVPHLRVYFAATPVEAGRNYPSGFPWRTVAFGVTARAGF